MEELDDELIQEYINKSQEAGMITEVIISALKQMKDNPTSTIEECLREGYWEWVK